MSHGPSGTARGSPIEWFWGSSLSWCSTLQLIALVDLASASPVVIEALNALQAVFKLSAMGGLSLRRLALYSLIKISHSCQNL
jgi:hypothetical protein